MKNYYDLLGVDKNATQKQINDAFKKLSIKFHPDKNGGDPYYVELFQVINEARQVLSDEAKRIDYDYSLKKPFSGRSFYGVTEEFLQRKKYTAAKKFSKQDLKRVKWPLSVIGLGLVITLIFILTNEGIKYFAESSSEKAALSIKVLKRDSLYDDSQVTDIAKESPKPFTSDIATLTDSAKKTSGAINKPLKLPAENSLSSNNNQNVAAEKTSGAIKNPSKIPAKTPLSSNNKQKAVTERTSRTINKPLKIPAEISLSSNNNQKVAAEKTSGAINKPLKLHAETSLSNNNKQKAAREKTVVELGKTTKKTNQVTKPSPSSERLTTKKAFIAPAFTAADTKVINNVLLSRSQMTNILNGILSRKAETGNKINCVKILVTNGSNVINAFKVANFLRANGLVIAGRETIKQKIAGVKIAAYKDCINVTIGNL